MQFKSTRIFSFGPTGTFIRACLVVVMSATFAQAPTSVASDISGDQSKPPSLLNEGVSPGVVKSAVYDDREVGLPVRIKIPKIKVDAAIEYTGLTPQGSMGVPKNQNVVAWLELGQRPGEIGSSVIAGHYGWWNWRAAAFDNLYKLRKGDTVLVEDKNGERITFVVREVRRYDPKADALQIFGINDGVAHLNLVTCEGLWKRTAQGYSKRLVVFTDRVLE